MTCCPASCHCFHLLADEVDQRCAGSNVGVLKWRQHLPGVAWPSWHAGGPLAAQRRAVQLPVLLLGVSGLRTAWHQECCLSFGARWAEDRWGWRHLKEPASMHCCGWEVIGANSCMHYHRLRPPLQTTICRPSICLDMFVTDQRGDG